jgi:uncharacterized protein YkwD
MKNITKKYLTLFAVLFISLLVSLIIPQKAFAASRYLPWSWFDRQMLMMNKILAKLPSPTPTQKRSCDAYPSLSPTVTPTPTPTPIKSEPSPTSSPTPTPESPIPTPRETSAKDYIMNAINDYRRSKGLSPVSTDRHTCDFAKVRAQEISTNFSHDGFNQRVNNRTLPYPSYALITENIAMTSDYRNVVNLWANSAGHAANMEKDTPYVCVEAYGNYYAYEGWRP